MKGIVKWFSSQMGYGFITDCEGNDIFVHYTGIVSEKEFKTLRDRLDVTFDVIETDKGRQAVNVKVVPKTKQ